VEKASKPAIARLATVIECINRENVALRDDLTLLSIDDGLNKAQRKETAEQPLEDKMETVFHLNFPSQPDRLKLVRSAVFDTAMLCGCSENVARDIVIAVDEACQNVIRHAYKGAPDGQVILDIGHDGDNMVLSLQDFAAPVDVSKIKPRDLDDLRPGGLGTHFINEMMDQVDFIAPPEGVGNLLRMVRKIE
jgi:sigma-B regulation protein RsbU (phosphoserine phosphatase)